MTALVRTLLFAGREIDNVGLVGEDIELDCTTVAALRTPDELLVEGPRRRYRFTPGGVAREIGDALPAGTFARAVTSSALTAIESAILRVMPYSIDALELVPIERGIYVLERSYVQHFGFDQLGFIPRGEDPDRWRLSEALTIQRWFRDGAIVHLRVDPSGQWTCGTESGLVDHHLFARIAAFATEYGPWQSNGWFNECDHRGWLVSAATSAWHSVDGDQSPLGLALREFIDWIADAIPALRIAFR